MNELIAALPESIKDEALARLLYILAELSHGRAVPPPKCSPELLLLKLLETLPGVEVHRLNPDQDPEEFIADAQAAAEAALAKASRH